MPRDGVHPKHSVPRGQEWCLWQRKQFRDIIANVRLAGRLHEEVDWQTGTHARVVQHPPLVFETDREAEIDVRGTRRDNGWHESSLSGWRHHRPIDVPVQLRDRSVSPLRGTFAIFGGRTGRDVVRPWEVVVGDLGQVDGRIIGSPDVLVGPVRGDVGRMSLDAAAA